MGDHQHVVWTARAGYRCSAVIGGQSPVSNPGSNSPVVSPGLHDSHVPAGCLPRYVFLCSLMKGPGDTPPSGEQPDDIWLQIMQEMWDNSPQSKKKLKKKPLSGGGGGGAAGATAGASAGAVAATAAGSPGEVSASTMEGVEQSIPMPKHWVHKESLIFALLGRPAGKGQEYH